MTNQLSLFSDEECEPLDYSTYKIMNKVDYYFTVINPESKDINDYFTWINTLDPRWSHFNIEE